MQCPKCDYENREGAKFCRECGEALDRICLECQHHNELDAKFCGECGAKLTEIARMGNSKLGGLFASKDDTVVTLQRSVLRYTELTGILLTNQDLVAGRGSM
jgi:hypothetical protein